MDTRRQKGDNWIKFARRMIKQSAIFNFNNKNANEVENDQEQFKTCLDIFKVLNLLKVNTDKQKQTYLEYFEAQEQAQEESKEKRKMLTMIQEEENAFKNRNVKKDRTNYLDDPDYAIYRSGYINPNELKPLRKILNPYVAYLNSLIPKAKFENNADFTTFTLDSNIKDSKISPQNTDSTRNNPSNASQNTKDFKQLQEFHKSKHYTIQYKRFCARIHNSK